MTMIGRRLFLAMTFALVQGSASAQMNHNHASEAACEDIELRCATKVMPAFA